MWQCSSGALALMCRFGQFSAPAFGCGSLYSAQAKCGSAVLALSRSCVGLGRSLLQPMAAEAFIPHRTNVAVQSWRSVTPAWVWAILCSSWWLRKRFFRTGQMWQCSPDALALLYKFGPFSVPAVGCRNLHSAPAKFRSCVSCTLSGRVRFLCCLNVCLNVCVCARAWSMHCYGNSFSHAC